jgi:hypothetical protein
MGALGKLRFSKIPGGGVVIVTYPLIFTSG